MGLVRRRLDSFLEGAGRAMKFDGEKSWEGQTPGRRGAPGGNRSQKAWRGAVSPRVRAGFRAAFVVPRDDGVTLVWQAFAANFVVSRASRKKWAGSLAQRVSAGGFRPLFRQRVLCHAAMV
jgi:hypothetical protein